MKPGRAWQESQVGVKKSRKSPAGSWCSRPGGESRHRALTSCDHPFG